MAKPPETRDRYKIYAETTLEQMGFVIAALTRMGLENIGYELITDVVTWRQKGERKVFETSAEQETIEYIKENPTFKVSDLITHFKTQERTPAAAYTAVRVLVEKGTLLKLNPGMYQSTGVKALAPPAGEKPSMRGKNYHPQREITNWDFIANAMKGRKRITSTELRALFEEDGRTPASISPIINKMRTTEMIRDISPGEYEILARPKPGGGKVTPTTKAKEKDRLRQQAKRDAAKKAKLNGTSTPTSEETTHG